jgi:hypothetical protein
VNARADRNRPLLGLSSSSDDDGFSPSSIPTSAASTPSNKRTETQHRKLPARRRTRTLAGYEQDKRRRHGGLSSPRIFWSHLISPSVGGPAAGDANTTSQASYSRCTLLSAMMCGGNATAMRTGTILTIQSSPARRPRAHARNDQPDAGGATRSRVSDTEGVMCSCVSGLMNSGERTGHRTPPRLGIIKLGMVRRGWPRKPWASAPRLCFSRGIRAVPASATGNPGAWDGRALLFLTAVVVAGSHAPQNSDKKTINKKNLLAVHPV